MAEASCKKVSDFSLLNCYTDIKYIYEDVAAFEYGSDKLNRLEENRHSGSVNHYVGGLIFRILRARMLPFWQVFLRKPIYRKHRPVIY